MNGYPFRFIFNIHPTCLKCRDSNVYRDSTIPLYESLKIDPIALADSFLGYNFRPKLDEWHPEKKGVWKNGLSDFRQKKPDGTCMFNFHILSSFGGVYKLFFEKVEWRWILIGSMYGMKYIKHYQTPTYGWFFMVNVDRHTIHGSYKIINYQWCFFFVWKKSPPYFPPNHGLWSRKSNSP